jgi:hypothetical protein
MTDLAIRAHALSDQLIIAGHAASVEWYSIGTIDMVAGQTVISESRIIQHVPCIALPDVTLTQRSGRFLDE